MGLFNNELWGDKTEQFFAKSPGELISPWFYVVGDMVLRRLSGGERGAIAAFTSHARARRFVCPMERR